MKIDFIILGAGMVGRFAKLLMPDAVCFEKGKHGDRTTVDCLGANMSRVIVPEIKCTPGNLSSRINGQVAAPNSIQRFKLSKGGTASLSYGDIKQFLPKQRVYFMEKPDVEVNFGVTATRINTTAKEIIIKTGETESKHEYGCIISTIPLPMILKLLDLFDGASMNLDGMLPYRPIYYKEERLPSSMTPEDEVLVDYLVSDETPLYRKQYCGTRMSCESYYKFEGATPLFPGKIFATEQAEQIARDLQLYGIYCYGRYARWRPAEHLHETFKNLRRFAERKGQIGYC